MIMDDKDMSDVERDNAFSRRKRGTGRARRYHFLKMRTNWRHFVIDYIYLTLAIHAAQNIMSNEPCSTLTSIDPLTPPLD